MKKLNKFLPEVREHAARMVQEVSIAVGEHRVHRTEDSGVSQTLNKWAKQAEVEAGVRKGVATGKAQRTVRSFC